MLRRSCAEMSMGGSSRSSGESTLWQSLAEPRFSGGRSQRRRPQSNNDSSDPGLDLVRQAPSPKNSDRVAAPGTGKPLRQARTAGKPSSDRRGPNRAEIDARRKRASRSRLSRSRPLVPIGRPNQTHRECSRAAGHRRVLRPRRAVEESERVAHGPSLPRPEAP
jgi:hypothetical protein